MQYGRWPAEEPEAILDGDRLSAIEYRWEPEELTNQGFEIVGTLSGMFAAYYAEHTVDRGEVMQIRAPLRPNWFEPLVSELCPILGDGVIRRRREFWFRRSAYRL